MEGNKIILANVTRIEIAEKMGVSANCVKNSIEKGTKILKRYYIVQTGYFNKSIEFANEWNSVVIPLREKFNIKRAVM